MRSGQSFRHFPPEPADLASRFWRSLVYIEDSWNDDLDLVKVGPDQSPNAEHARLAGLDDLGKERTLRCTLFSFHEKIYLLYCLSYVFQSKSNSYDIEIG
jgi:hypothetical protein